MLKPNALHASLRLGNYAFMSATLSHHLKPVTHSRAAAAAYLSSPRVHGELTTNRY